MKIAENVFGYRTAIVNIAYIAGLGSTKKDWVLVDTGVPYSAPFILKNTKKLFNEKKPLAIILTHAHFDHIGALQTLVHEWNVPVYIHEKEIPYLESKKKYPPPTPFKEKGMMSFLSPFYPRDGIDFHSRIKPISSEHSLAFLEGWEWIYTPGHTNGHISLFREKDRLLLAGDALITVKQESLFAVLTQEKEIHGPPAYFTPDVETSIISIKKLLALDPQILYTGHGVPMYGKEIREGISDLLYQHSEEAVVKGG
ncbi:MBL fold metallo-hydrolase [Niallia sp. FSL W8-0635]|uniref:MBL fold metallo-hydrolase n=1 Tax=Niallia sp. FSL W8-0635 TaxID=2975337 RepID=UPI0009C8F3B1|nr:Zn-dependent hydrolase, glyoxylase [Mycobacteroides abscessus subsp. abscessus]HEO8419077.1 MBL fold metallo-hydrolase [Yersinia enterocolitica]